MNTLHDALKDHFHNMGSYLEALDRTRPYTGQPHTDHGERGKQLVTGLTMRDIYDCFIIGCFHASGLPPSEYPAEAWDLPWGEMDIAAVGQSMGCEIEKRMRVYPNIPPLEEEPA